MDEPSRTRSPVGRRPLSFSGPSLIVGGVIGGALTAALLTLIPPKQPEVQQAAEPTAQPAQTEQFRMMTKWVFGGKSFDSNDKLESRRAPITVDPVFRPEDATPSYFGQLLNAYGKLTYAQVTYLLNGEMPYDNKGKTVGKVKAEVAAVIHFTADHKGVTYGESPIRVFARGEDGEPKAIPTAYHWKDRFTVLVTGMDGRLPEYHKFAAYSVVNNREIRRSYIDVDRCTIQDKTFVLMGPDGKPVTDPVERRKAWFEARKVTRRVPVASSEDTDRVATRK